MEVGDSRSGETGARSSSASEFPSPVSNGSSADRRRGSPSSGSANAKSRKNGSGRGANMGRTILNSVNKSASQIRKPPHRRSSSPVNWFPRKKTESFLKRKIKLLQETEGMNTSLDETLGNANPHYTRIAREKLAARAAARKAMEARRAAMIEASWCRILHAARIHNKEAEDKLQKAEEYVAEAFEAARTMGVMMYDRPDCPRQSCEIETSSAVGGTSTHKVTASFETTFDVDKEVAAAVKNAFIRLASCPSSSNKGEFDDLLRKFSQNPDVAEKGESDISLQHERVTGSQVEPELPTMDLCSNHQPRKISQNPDLAEKGTLDVSLRHELVTGLQVEPELPNSDVSSNNSMKKHESMNKHINVGGMLVSDSQRSSQSSQDLVDAMFDRLKNLTEDEISSLAVIVATCGLNAALLEMGKGRNPGNVGTSSQVMMPSKPSTEVGTRRLSSVSSFIHGHFRKKEPMAELPSLDKFLVKHVTRLEKEVQEARNSNKKSELPESEKEASEKQISKNGWTLVHTERNPQEVFMLERDIQDAKTSMKGDALATNSLDAGPYRAQSSETGQSSRPSNEIQEANTDKQAEEGSMQERNHFCGVKEDSEKNGAEIDAGDTVSLLNGKEDDKENVDLNKISSATGVETKKGSVVKFQKSKAQSSRRVRHHIPRFERAKLETLRAFSAGIQVEGDEVLEHLGLDKILIKPVHRLEREKKKLEVEENRSYTNQKCIGTKNTAVESLDKILVKHVSRLEREKMAAKAAALEDEETRQLARSANQHLDVCVESLDKILVKHQSKLEKAKLAATHDQSLVVTAKDKKGRDPTSSEGLGQILVKHQSKLEKAKLEAATQEQSLFLRVKGKKNDQQLETVAHSLDQVLVKHESKLEKVKLAAVQESTDHVIYLNTWKETRDRELQEAWGGLSLGDTVKPHLSRLEREKADWKRAEEDNLRRAREA